MPRDAPAASGSSPDVDALAAPDGHLAGPLLRRVGLSLLTSNDEFERRSRDDAVECDVRLQELRRRVNLQAAQCQGQLEILAKEPRDLGARSRSLVACRPRCRCALLVGAPSACSAEYFECRRGGGVGCDRESSAQIPPIASPSKRLSALRAGLASPSRSHRFSHMWLTWSISLAGGWFARKPLDSTAPP